MSKYRKHYASKYEYPTRVIGQSMHEGTLVIGHTVARRDIERRIGRPLSQATKVRTRGGNWCFLEPRLTTAPQSA